MSPPVRLASPSKRRTPYSCSTSGPGCTRGSCGRSRRTCSSWWPGAARRPWRRSRRRRRSHRRRHSPPPGDSCAQCGHACRSGSSPGPSPACRPWCSRGSGAPCRRSGSTPWPPAAPHTRGSGGPSRRSCSTSDCPWWGSPAPGAWHLRLDVSIRPCSIGMATRAAQPSRDDGSPQAPLTVEARAPRRRAGHKVGLRVQVHYGAQTSGR